MNGQVGVPTEGLGKTVLPSGEASNQLFPPGRCLHHPRVPYGEALHLPKRGIFQAQDSAYFSPLPAPFQGGWPGPAQGDEASESLLASGPEAPVLIPTPDGARKPTEAPMTGYAGLWAEVRKPHKRGL